MDQIDNLNRRDLHILVAKSELSSIFRKKFVSKEGGNWIVLVHFVKQIFKRKKDKKEITTHVYIVFLSLLAIFNSTKSVEDS